MGKKENERGCWLSLRGGLLTLLFLAAVEISRWLDELTKKRVG
jgi:hypothetical protein